MSSASTNLGIREAARRLADLGHKVTHVALVHQIKRGAIPTEPDGGLNLDRVLASEWMQSRLTRGGKRAMPRPIVAAVLSDPAIAPASAAVESIESEGIARACKSPIPDTQLALEDSETSINADPNDMQAVTALSKIDIEKLKLAEQWRSARLDNDERQKKLVPANEVESAVESRFRDDAQALLNWPSTVSKQMAAELGVDDQLMLVILEKYVREFMQERSNVPVAVLAA